MSLFGNSANKGSGLSINTGAANLFNSPSTNPPQQSQPQAGNSLFSSAAATTQPSLFASNTSTTASAGTLFGAGTNTTSSGSSLFSNTATANAPSQAGTLFGGAAANKPAGGGLFGNNTATTTQSTGGGPFATAPATSQSAAGGGGLFGGAMNSQPAAGGGIFGAKPATTQSTSLFGGNTGGGLFGASAQQKPAQTTSLFGQQPAQQTNSLFGQPAAAPAATTAGTSLFGNSAAQSARPALNQPQQFAPQQTQRSIFTSSIGQYTAAQTAVPGVRIDASNLRPTTRFADLHEVLQQELERLDDLILRQQKHAEECEQAMPAVSHALSYVPADAEYCARKLDAMQSALEADAGDIDDLKSKTRACADDAKICFKNVSALRTPAQFSLGPGAGPVPAGLLDGSEVAPNGQDLHRYLDRQMNDMADKFEKFKRGLSEVESYLGGVEANTFAGLETAKLRSTGDGRARSADDQIRELANVLREFEGGIMGVATKVGGLREKTQEAMIEEAKPRGRLGGLY